MTTDRQLRLLGVSLAAVLITTLTWSPLGAKGQIVSGAYAIRGARIVTVSGAVIDKGTVVMRNGLIEDVGAAVNAPADAVAIDGTNLTVYPGLIDMANSAVVDMPAAEVSAQATAAAGRGGAGGGGRAGGSTESYADVERARRENILNPDFEAARYVRSTGPELQRLAAAGITSVLAVPSAGLFRGQSALVNTAAPADEPSISRVAGDRHGLVVVRAGVAEHVAFAAGRGGGGGGGYPGSLLGVMAFIRQSFYDAQWQRDARAYGERHKDAPRQAFESSLDALAPALEGKMPVAFEANQLREILRALAFAKEFKLDPIIVGGTEASPIVEDLRAAKARVICSVSISGAGRAGGGGRGGGGGGAPNAAAQDAPKVAALLDKAGIVFAFTSQGLQSPGDLVRGVGRAIRDGGLPAEAALRGLTSNAAKLAGVGDRLGTIEKGRIANLVVTDGDLFSDQTHIKHVFVDGRPVDLDVPVAAVAPAGRGRGGQ